MGYNTTVLILNDVLDEIEKNPAEFVFKLRNAAALYTPDGGPTRRFGVGRYGNGVEVGSVEHADVVSVLIAGRNTIIKVSAEYPAERGIGDKPVALKILQRAAKNLKAEIARERLKEVTSEHEGS